MKKFYCLLFLFFCTYTLNAYPNPFTIEKEKKKEGKNTNYLKIKKNKGYYGVLNEKDKKNVIPYIYDKITAINDEGFAAKKKDKWIIYNTLGEQISPSYSFEKIHIPSSIDGDNKIIVIGKERKNRSEAICIIKNETGYYFNSYDNIQSISPHYYHITKDAKQGTLTLTGKEIIAPIYTTIFYLRPSKKGEPYIAKVQNEYSGFINLASGEVIVPAKWEDAEIISPTLFKVYDNSKWGIVDDQNREILPTEYNYITALSPKLIKVENNHEIFFVSIDKANVNQKIIPSDSLQIEQKNLKFGVTTKDNKIIIPFEYTNIINTPQQVFIANKNGKYKLIDYSGKEISPFYKNIEFNDLSQNFLIENKKGKWDVMNYKGEILLETKFSKKEKLITFFNEPTLPKNEKIKKERSGSSFLEIAGVIVEAIGITFFYAVYCLVYIIVYVFDLTYI